MDHEIMNTEVLNEGIPGIGFVEHCVVVYDTNILGRVPNAMMVHIPHGRMSEDALIDDDLPYLVIKVPGGCVVAFECLNV